MIMEKDEDIIKSEEKEYKKTEDTVFIKKALKIAEVSKNDSLIRAINIDYGIQSYFKKDLKYFLLEH